jgi:hypothetical protein
MYVLLTYRAQIINFCILMKEQICEFTKRQCSQYTVTPVLSKQTGKRFLNKNYPLYYNAALYT